MEGMPLLPCSAATPLLSVDARGGPDNDDADDDTCSFEEILLANNISVDSCEDLTLDHSSKYNIVLDLEDDCPESALKISNVPSVVEDANRLGSPSSHRPFHRRDYSRVLDSTTQRLNSRSLTMSRWIESVSPSHPHWCRLPSQKCFYSFVM